MIRVIQHIILVCGFLTISIFFCADVSAQASYDEVEIAKLRYFLLQESAEPGVRNYEQLGMTSMENIEWSTVRGLYWNSLTHYLERVRWPSSKLSGHMDFSDFAGLIYLEFYYNEIKSVKVTNTPKLQRIDAYTNDLTEIDVTTNPALNYLRLGFNNISSLNLSNNPNLGFLCCTSNRLSSLDVSNKENLYTLYCLGNNINSLLINNCTRLETLLCDLNRLENLNINNMPILKTLSCAGNGLKELQLHDCVSLEELTCNNNEISALDLSKCKFLTKVNCNSNKIASLNLEGCKNLTSLYCENNFLYSLDISSSPLLSSIACKNNNLTFLTLPLPTEKLTYYSYYPQYYVALECEYNNIDFSDFYMIDGNESKYDWFYQYSTINPLEKNNGSFAFDEAYIGETFICRVLNNALPMLTMHYDVTFTQGTVSNVNQAKDKPVVYAGEQTIHIMTILPVTVSIYSLQGKLIMKKQVEAGHTGIPVERGSYVVVVNDMSSYKLIVR